MAKVKIELNKKGVGELLKSKDMQQVLEKLAEEKSGGWETDTKMMGTRVIASIYSVDRDKVSEELDSHRIVGGLGR